MSLIVRYFYAEVLITHKPLFLSRTPEVDPGFGGGGGGGGALKIMCQSAHHEREAWSPLWPGSSASLRALEALGF